MQPALVWTCTKNDHGGVPFQAIVGKYMKGQGFHQFNCEKLWKSFLLVCNRTKKGQTGIFCGCERDKKIF